MTVDPITGGSISLTEGDLTINADGSFTFTPATNFNGPVPQVTYTISDGSLTDTATLDITINPVNDAPVANNDTARVTRTRWSAATSKPMTPTSMVTR